MNNHDDEVMHFLVMTLVEYYAHKNRNPIYSH